MGFRCSIDDLEGHEPVRLDLFVEDKRGPWCDVDRGVEIDAQGGERDGTRGTAGHAGITESLRSVMTRHDDVSCRHPRSATIHRTRRVKLALIGCGNRGPAQDISTDRPSC